ncbi:hypothetical protein SCG7086_CM_00090 [Chlamydiales bacterium SCGC AG-110-P3]|nr:hypothetical protein SCG7086_CM_00090 [Chlamydiales bacterium SCGC AG-110-P3]
MTKNLPGIAAPENQGRTILQRERGEKKSEKVAG